MTAVLGLILGALIGIVVHPDIPVVIQPYSGSCSLGCSSWRC